MVERTLSHLQTEVKNAATSAKSAKLMDLFRDKAAIKGLIITLGLFGAQQFCGIMAMVIVGKHFTSSSMNFPQLKLLNTNCNVHHSNSL